MGWTDIAGFVIACLSLIATSILTVIIIMQTNKNTKDQIALQEKLTKQQQEFEAKQLELGQRPDNIKILKTIFKIYSFVELIDMRKIASKKTYEQLGILFSEVRKQMGIDAEEINVDLYVGEMVATQHIKPTIEKIRKSFWEISELTARFNLSFLELTDEEKANEKDKLEWIWKHIDVINETKSYISAILNGFVKL